MYASSGTGDDSVPGLSAFEWLAEQRIGVGPKITRKPAEDAIRGRFTIRDFQGKEYIDEDLMDWMEDPNIDFYNVLVQALYYERVFGIAFIMKYYTESDREKADFSKPAPKGKKPVGLQAFPPTLMSPVDEYRTTWLDTNPQKWDLQGGLYNAGRIHHTRVHVLMTRRSATRWRGLSIFEPIWIAIMSYFQAQIYTLRAFSEMGNVIPTWLIDDPLDDLEELWTERASLLGEMKMNGMFIGKKGDEFIFPTTNIGAGLKDLVEGWKEDISAGTNIPVNLLWGRITASGIGQGGYQVQERYYSNELGNIQSQITDDVIRFLAQCGFPEVGVKKWLDWKLTITKTDEQRLMDEGMEIQNEILKEQLMQSRLETDFMMKNAQEGKPLDGKEMEPEGSKPKKTDFFAEAIKLKRLQRLEEMRGERKFLSL